ncbi:MAG: HDOD domain-containing protein [Gammaproteobacteria bacterium]|nr:HDOD domain-containing protein [Gammaproteobacteria bacterium]NND53345.1 HDOD domain-containing protein [Gammaproteobacteria bacterium]
MDQEVETEQLLRQLIADIGTENVELPAFPEVVNRLQLLLADSNVPMKDVAALIQSDPVLTAKLLRTANAAAFNTRGIEIDNLNVALNRLGVTLVRSIAVAFAMRQAEQEPYLAAIKEELREILRRSNYVAAIACATARRLPEVNADQAILAGLVHQIGTLYLMITVQRDHPSLTEHLDYAETVERLGNEAGAAVLRAWEFPPEICDAVRMQDQLLAAEKPDDFELEAMGKLLSAAKIRDRIEHDPTVHAVHPDVNGVLENVSFDEHNFMDVLAASHSEIRDIQESLNTNLA